MDKEQIKSKIDFSKIQEKESIVHGISFKKDYIVDSEGNFIAPISPIEMKLIEEIKDLKKRIKILEEKI